MYALGSNTPSVKEERNQDQHTEGLREVYECTFGQRRQQLADQSQRLLDLVLGSVGQVLQDDHVLEPASQALSALARALLVRLVRTGHDASQDLVDRFDHACLKERERHLGRDLGGGSESSEEVRVRAGGEERRAGRGHEERVERPDDVDVQQGLETLGLVPEGLDRSEDGQSSLLD